jgi:HEAT repeat protein
MAGLKGAVEREALHLRALPVERWRDYLRSRSGLPGPRANLELADAFAAVAERALILELADSADEYERFCGTHALGRLVVDEPHETAIVALLRERASDPLWRVREATARALQIVGDHDPARLAALVAEWVAAPEAYVRRAAIAGICEPRLLSTEPMRSVALAACASATGSIESLPASERVAADVRNLRQGLGYCWSVAVACDPVHGLPAFETLATIDDPDVRWIVTANLAKKRLQRVLAEQTHATSGRAGLSG